MRKVINGRTYNTETSKHIGSWNNELSYSDFGFCGETLYKNTKGAYFLYGEGGPMSKYSVRRGNETSGGSQLIPMAAEEAQSWAEEHLGAEDYEAEFGVQEEAAPSDLTTRERVNFTIDSEIMARLRKHSVDTGVPMARILDKIILAELEKAQIREEKAMLEKTLEIASELGQIPVETIEDLGKLQSQLKEAGYISYLDSSTDYLIIEKQD